MIILIENGNDEVIQTQPEKKQKKNMIMLLSVVLNIVLFIVCADTISVRLFSTSTEDKIWDTAVANGLYCAQSFAKNGSEEAYYYIIGEAGTLVDLLPYSTFGDNTQKKQFENLYKELVSYADVMKTKGKELEEIFTMLSEKDKQVFDKMEALYKTANAAAKKNGEENNEEE